MPYRRSIHHSASLDRLEKLGNVRKAILASVAMQRKLLTYNGDKAAEDQVLLCIGLGYGRVLRIGDNDVFGSQVNAASKLGEDTAQAWEILVTEAVREKAGELENLSFEPLDQTPAGAASAWKLIWR